MIKKIINNLQEMRAENLSRRKLRSIKKNFENVGLDDKLRLAYKERWKKISGTVSEDYAAVFSSLNGIQSDKYVPEDIYYTKIEPVLNNKAFALAYADKNFYERFLAGFSSVFPDTVLRGINGAVYDKSFNPLNSRFNYLQVFDTEGEYILKPATETSGGENVLLLVKDKSGIRIDEKVISGSQFTDTITNKYKNNFLLQKRIEQSSWFADFNPSSLNTVRIFSYRSVKDESVHSIHSIVRFGKPGSLVDNQAAGGLTCGINNKGFLNDFASDKWGKKYKLDFISKKAGSEVPGLSRMKEIVNKVAPYYNYHRLLGFDFSLDDRENVKLLEINCKNIETNFLQMNNGPLFGEFTDEIIEYCMNHKKSVVLDFYV